MRGQCEVMVKRTCTELMSADGLMDNGPRRIA